MLKSDIVNQIAQQTGITKSDTLLIIETFLQSIISNTEKGEVIYLKGFGKFSLKQRAKKIGRNVKNNTPILIPPKKILQFKVSKNIQQKIQSS